MCEFNSSTSPKLWMRTWLLGTRVLLPKPVLPASPVRVAMALNRLPMPYLSFDGVRFVNSLSL
jgi:hypothetical protein